MGHTLAYSCILWHTLAYSGILWHTLASSCILWHTLAYSGINLHTLAYSGILWHTLAYSGILWHTLPHPDQDSVLISLHGYCIAIHLAAYPGQDGVLVFEYIICFKQMNTKMKRHYMKMTEGSFFALTVSKNEVISFISNVCVTMSSTVCMCGIMSLISCDWMLEYLSSCTLLWVS